MIGTACYIYFGYSLMTCWLQDGQLDPEVIIEHAAFCMAFVLYWRYWLNYQMDHPMDGAMISYSVRNNFLTRETFLDVVISAAARVLVYVMYKVHPKLRKWKPCGSRMSSRFCEYLFQFIRMRNTNTPAMRALAALRHFRHYAAQMAIAGEADFDLPDYRRTISARISKGGLVDQRAPPGYYEEHITAEKIDTAIDKGMHHCRELLTNKCGFKQLLDVSKQDEFFSAPCLHFPTQDTFVSAQVLQALSEGMLPEDEEQGNDNENARDEPDLVQPPCSSGVEEDEAEQLRVSDVHREIHERLGYGEAEGEDDASRKAAWAAMNDEVSQFNRTMLQSMQQHRKWRFIKKKLFDQAAQSQGFAAGASEETERSKWQHYEYNDDVAVLIRVGDETMWKIGNIEQIGYLQRTLPEDASQERILNNFHKSEPFPKRVSIHDQKAVFTLRMYRECDNDGNVLPARINHAECINTPQFVFHLPVGETSLEPMSWVLSNDVLTGVRMLKDPLQQRVWKMNASDRNLMMRLYRAELP